MYGVIIEQGPQNWQILQQKDGFARVQLSGSVLVESWDLECEDAVVILRVLDENTNARVTAPVLVKPIDGKWSARLEIPAGGPYRIESYFRYNQFGEKRGDRRFHIGVGDVYVIAGQSNAAGNGKDAVDDPISMDVHMFRMSGTWDIASHPIHDGTDALFPLSQDRTQAGHSPWLIFGKTLAKNLGYPIGLIPTAVGGVPLSMWDRAVDGCLFDNMLEMVRQAGGEVKGILWYQGCSDTSPELRQDYLERFTRVCKDFEKTFFENIPILTVQLNKVTHTKDSDVALDGLALSMVREAQRQAAWQMKNVLMVPTIDLMVCDGIHNSAMSNLVIGQRVANKALRYIYDRNVICDAPDIERIVAEGNTARLYFANVYDRIFADRNQTEKLMFSLTDSLGRMCPVDYECPGDNSIILVFDREIQENAVICCDGYNDTGLMPYDMFSYLPVIPFHGQAVLQGNKD